MVRFSEISNFQDRVGPFISFLKPRIYHITKSNPESDFSWYVTSGSHRKTTISFTPFSKDDFIGNDMILQHLYEKYRNKVEFMVVNSSKLSEILRHTTSDSPEWAIFNLTKEYIYPKRFLKGFDPSLKKEENLRLIENQINEFLEEPKVYDLLQIGANEINTKQLEQLIKEGKPFYLRTSTKGCNDFKGTTKVVDEK